MTTIEEVKKFWDDRPCNIRHSASPVGSRQYFDEVEQKKHFVEPHILTFADFPSWKGKKVLEIGCGIGTAAVCFAREGAIYTGVELSQVSIDLAKKRFDVYGLEGTFHRGNAEELTTFVPVEEYDLVYSFGVIHHSPNPSLIVGNLEQYMGAKSLLKVMLYAKNSWKNFMIEGGLDQFEAQSGCPVAKTYDRTDIAYLFDGYRLLSVEQDHIFPYMVEPYKKNQYIKQPWFEAMEPNMFRLLEKRLGWHMLITAQRW